MPKYIKKLVYLEKPCKQCGKILIGTALQLSERVFCSKQCNANDRKAHNVKTCQECSEQFHARPGGNSTNQSGSYCSRSCYGAYLSRTLVQHSAHVGRMRAEIKRQQAKVVSLERKAAKVEAKAKKARDEQASLVCVAGCGKPSRSMRARCPDCAVEHAKAVRRATRHRDKAIRRSRQRINAEAIDPIRVFEMDKWKCQACGHKTPKSLRGTYDMRAPELDHIVSLKDGGSHTWANVRCLCRECNLIKGARSLGQIGLGFR